METKKVCMAMSNAADGDVSNLLEMALRNLNYPQERIIRYTLLVENALYLWQKELPAENELTVLRSDTPRTVRFRFALPGKRVDPFDVKAEHSGKENADNDLSMAQMTDRLLSGVGSELKYRYKNGTNIITLSLPKDHIETRLFSYNVMLLMIPLTLQTMFSTIASNIDTMMLGFQDTAVMSGVALASVFVTLPTVMIQSVVFGATTLMSQHWGKRDREGTQQVAGLSLLTAIVIAALFTLTAFFASDFIMGLYSNDPAVVASGSTYLHWISPSFLIMAVYLMLFCFMECTGGVKKALLYSVIGCTCNVVFNAVLIFGLFGVPAMGARGAALATILSALVQAVLAAVEFHRRGAVKIKFTAHYRIDYKTFAVCIATIGAQRLSWNLANNIISAAIGHMSPAIVTANSIMLVLSGFVMSMKAGFGKGVGLQMGAYLGKNQFDLAKKRASDAQKFGVKAAALLVPVFVLVGFSFRYMPMDFSKEAVRYMNLMLLLYAVNSFFSFMNALQNQGFLYAGGDTKAILVIDTLVMWGILVPVAMLSMHTSLLPPMVTLVILEWSEVFSFPLKFGRVHQYKWLKNLT